MSLSAPIFILVVLFGSSAWMGTNGVWMELPLITSVLPEGWSLPSYLAAVVQIACIGPLVYGVWHKCLCNLHTPTLIVCALVLLSTCCLGLAAFWDVTVDLFGQQYSLALYALLFGVALVNSTSNVLFMPFMSQFHPAYLNAYFGGMGLSSLVPSLVSLIQGSSKYECLGNGTSKTPLYAPPRFGVSIFFLIVFLWSIIAFISFLVILYNDHHNEHSRRTEKREEETSKEDPHEGTPLTGVVDAQAKTTGSGTLSSSRHEVEQSPLSNLTLTWILLLTAVVNAQMNGVIPSIHSYAALPYSQTVYHLGVTLSNIVSPLSSFLPFFLQIRSTTLLTIMSFSSTTATAFIVYMASRSPEYLFGDFTAGSTLAIVAPMIAAGLHSYLRTIFASLLREGSHGSEKRLFWCGVFIQIGSFVGSAVMFPLVNMAHLFKSAPPCR